MTAGPPDGISLEGASAVVFAALALRLACWHGVRHELRDLKSSLREGMRFVRGVPANGVARVALFGSWASTGMTPPPDFKKK